MSTDFQSFEEFRRKLSAHLLAVYPDEDIERLADRCIEAIGPRQSRETIAHEALWSEYDALLITYGDTLREPAEAPLRTLERFLAGRLTGIVSAVHILPFFPFSSDDGFAVIDHTRVNPELGRWEDVSRIGATFKLMADVVINHASSQSTWFKNFQYVKNPGADYFVEADPHHDLSAVTRPRSTPLLQPRETMDGIKHVWCTFGFDQIDLDFSNPEVLLAFVRILALYIDTGVQWLRLDAVAYLWKQIGTACIHLPQTHEIIKLLRLLAEYKNPCSLIITETNVPNRENLTYFGNSNETHMIYNFSLPPLTLHALMSGDCRHLTSWLTSMPSPPVGCTYLNFTASHDGIGLRPAEGLLSERELGALLSTMRSFGGRISTRTGKNGNETPYEINISLFDAMKGTHQGTDQWRIERFVCSQIIMMSIQGIPAFYIHSLLATPNDLDRLSATGQNRAINRRRWHYGEIVALLDNPRTDQARVFTELKRLIAVRRRQPAFHPNAAQSVMHLTAELFGFRRQASDGQIIYCVNNVSDRAQELPLTELNLAGTETWTDLIGDTPVSDPYGTVTLQPYQCIWIANHCY